ncbi:hypothetical protein J4N45_10965 [Vibrio sp. SCSIO 43140]|uniref:hypothetical protein n=1 Tax=Vibrio sp. SCSIO 43140 TaxID=2819100 RepID=UPI0020754246|nr:hypothetical protein [Vibrio sp. SCSIO 43140]USD59051.1 hypothetical protein J4N45_10965 [Vibrio sp. SCSIO 43140]
MSKTQLTPEQETFVDNVVGAVWMSLWKRVVFTLICIAIIGYVANSFGLGFDETDNIEEGTRSQLTVRTDYKSGCQYLSYRDGGLTPRLDVNGQHMGCKASSSLNDDD